MKILIYEEEKIYRDRLQDRIDDFLAEKDVKPLEQLVIKDDTQVYQIMATISQNNIYFISLENIGLNIARVIRDLDPLGYIILLSSGFPDYQAIFNKKISALTVIHKDVNFDYELTSVFQYILRRYRQVRKIVNVIEIQSKPVNLVLVKMKSLTLKFLEFHIKSGCTVIIVTLNFTVHYQLLRLCLNTSYVFIEGLSSILLILI